MSLECSIETAGLRYFGQMSASMSHEIKNALAIIQEGAGLLEDLSGKASPASGASTDRLLRIAQMINRQVGRADGVVKTLNRFAHSADTTYAATDVMDLLEWVSALSSRLLRLRGVQLRLQAPGADQATVIHTCPFLLAELIWRCLNFAAEHNSGDCIYDIHARRIAKNMRICIAGIENWDKLAQSVFPGPIEQAIADRLAAAFEMDAERQSIILTLPKTNMAVMETNATI